MTSLQRTACLAPLLIGLICLSCSSGPSITISLVGVPQGTQVVRVNRALNGAMAMDPRIFTSFDPPKVRLRMAPGEVGSVRLMVDAMNETADRMRCVLASGEGVVVVGTADVEITIDLHAAGRTGCEPIDPPPADMSVPDLNMADLRPAGDMKCVPRCRSDECEVSDGCGGMCKCAVGLVCDSPSKTCGMCLPARTRPCEYCYPDDCFDKVNLNPGMQTCTGEAKWGACMVSMKKTLNTKASDPIWNHRCGVKDGDSWVLSSVPTTPGCLMIDGSPDAVGNLYMGRHLPPGPYRIRFNGMAYGADFPVGITKVTFSLYSWEEGKDVFSNTSTIELNAPMPGIPAPPLPVFYSTTFNVGADCQSLIVRVRTEVVPGTLIKSIRLFSIDIEPI